MSKLTDRQLNAALQNIVGAVQIDGNQAYFSRDDWALLGNDALDVSLAAGLIKTAPPAQAITCPGCEYHCLMPVEFQLINAASKPIVVCDKRDDIGIVKLNDTHLERWQTSLELIANCLSLCIASPMPPRELLPGKFYFIGRKTFADGRATDMVLALGGLTDSGYFQSLLNPVALSIDCPAPPPPGWLPFASVVYFKDEQLFIEHEQILQAMTKSVAIKAGNQANVFTKSGATWHVCFAGVDKNVRHSNGMIYIRELLSQPNKEFHCAQLQALTIKSGGVYSQGLEKTDNQTVKSVAARAQSLDAQIAAAVVAGNDALAATHRAEKERLREYASATMSMGGKSSMDNAPQDKSRQAVKQALTLALKNIKTEHPQFFNHIENAIKTGNYCSYEPNPGMIWNV